MLRDEFLRLFRAYVLSLSEKLVMREFVGKSLLAEVVTLLLISCGVSEIGEFEKDENNGIWTGPSHGVPPVSRSITYVTAFDYPDGYDWFSDSEKGAVKCSLAVFADGRPILKVPVGDQYCVSSDPDMHRMIDGHLYTDFATDDETVIKKDGKPFLSFEGRESVTAMMVKGDSLYTLGHKRNGKGFVFRINGQTVLERDSGYAFGRLADLGDDIAFAFAEPINSAEGGQERYYCFMDGKVVQTALREDVRKVWDIVIHGGKIFYLASLTGVFEPVIVSESSIEALSLPFQTRMVTGQLFSVGSLLGTEMILSSNTGLSSAIWLQNRILRNFDPGMTVASIWSGEEGIFCLLNGRAGMSAVFRMGEYILLPDGYACLGSSPIDMADGMLTVGLSSLTGARPLIWKDGDVEELDVNGYICTVSSVRTPR